MHPCDLKWFVCSENPIYESTQIVVEFVFLQILIGLLHSGGNPSKNIVTWLNKPLHIIVCCYEMLMSVYNVALF